MNELCRICNEINSFRCKNIFDDKNSNIVKKLQACANILLEKEDDLSKVICESCEAELHFAYKFRIKCEENDAKIRQELAQKKKLVNEEADVSYNQVSFKDEGESTLHLVEVELIEDLQINENTIKDEDEDELDELSEFVENLNPEDKKHNDTKKTKSSRANKSDYKCETCETVIHKRKDYLIHIKSHGRKRFQCQICFNWYQCKNKVKMHMDEVHSRNGGSVCELCGKQFSNARNLQRHIVDYHEQRKPYKCETCGLSFARSYVLSQHCSSVHSTEKNWHCDQCKKSFKLETYLKLHIKQTHRTEDKITRKKIYVYKKVICPECGKLCQSNGALKEHLRWHTGDKPYQCTTCGKSFGMRNALYRHNMVHKGLKPYKCDICQVSFRQSNHLRIHTLVHTGEKPHQCDICDRAFSTKGNLTAHQKLHLGIKNKRTRKSKSN